MVTADDVSVSKPAPDVFLEAIRRTSEAGFDPGASRALPAGRYSSLLAATATVRRLLESSTLSCT